MLAAITGARGFLGRYLTAEFKAAGYQVRGCSRTPKRPPTGPDQRSTPPIQWVVGNLDDPQSLVDFVQGADVVVHAAVHLVGTGFMDTDSAPADFYATNVVGTQRLLQAAADANVGRFINVSSGAVHDRVLQHRPLDENHPLRPASLYGATKAATETLVHHYGISGKLNACSVRPTAIYGVDSPLHASRWFELIAAVARGEPVNARGGGKTVHAGDVARACRLLAETKARTCSETYNCTDRMISNVEVATETQRISGSSSVIQGHAKPPGKVMSTRKIEDAVGMTFGGTVLLRDTISKILQGLSSPSS